MALERIVARTRADVARRKERMPLATFAGRLVPSTRSLAAALRAPRTGFILECKRASPSAGLLRPEYDPAALAASYGRYADAISVVTDAPFFQGCHDDLRRVRDQVALPLLCKDFVVEPYQVFEARAYGADAVLLMLSVLDPAGYRACAAAARAVGMETVTEVHTERELDLALSLGAPIVGINNRDLRTLKVDFDPVRRLAPRVPADRVVVCESGIGRHAEVVELRAGVDGFLVGSSLIRERDLDHATRRLVFGAVKVCGLTRPEDARAAWEAGATHGGLIFAPESPRAVSEAQAAAVRAAAPLQWVGVFVNQAPEQVADRAACLRLAAVQLHGEETRPAIERLRPLLPAGCEIWKAIRVRHAVPPVQATGADRLLLDAWDAGQRGGTGARFDWSLVSPGAERDRLILSGGLTPDLAAEADRLGLWALDVNSGVEERPGVKSAPRLAHFFAALRGPGREERVPA